MKPFKYVHPETPDQASDILNDKKEHPARLFAGGTDLLGMLKDDIAGEVNTLVNLKKIPGLDTIEYEHGKGFTIGALVTLNRLAVSDIIRNKVPVIAQAAEEVASPQLRHIGTLGGNLCQRPRCWYFRGGFDCYRHGGGECFAEHGENKYHCVIGGSDCFIVHPSDMATALTALNAELSIQSGDSLKKVPISDFYVLPDVDIEQETVLKKGDVITHIHIPDDSTQKTAVFIKERTRQAFDFATVSVAVCVEKRRGKVKSGSIVLGGVAPVPWLEIQCSDMLSGVTLNESVAEGISKNALSQVKPLSDNEYKVILAKNLIKRALLSL